MSTEYLFIDGGYLKESANKAMNKLFGADADLNIWLVRNAYNSFKSFYYDCLDDVQHPDETPEVFHHRVRAQEDYFNRIQSMQGFHVRLGTLTGSPAKRRLRQKEVDVQLAVDLMWHAFQKNMDRATLLTGDLDFRPVVNAVIQMGTFVRLAYFRGATSKDLFWAADQSAEIDLFTLYNWCTQDFKNRHLMPEGVSGFVPRNLPKVDSVAISNIEYGIYDCRDGWFISEAAGTQWRHRDAALLRRYVEMVLG